MTSAHRNRPTSRVLLFDRDDRILLFLTTAPDTSGVARWLTPGGGVDAGETFEQAARRELFEETGLVVEALGEPAWSHAYDVEWDSADHDTGHAEFFVHDAGSRNGVALGVRGERSVKKGQRVLVGDQVLRVESVGL